MCIRDRILSDSEKLELMLRGLIDKNTRGLKEGSTLILELRPAGQKLKLQLKVQKLDSNQKESLNKDKGSDISPVLNWNPQTGSLQLSQNATQKLLASLGGHVTQRRDTGLTVFFPISDSKWIEGKMIHILNNVENFLLILNFVKYEC